jgi:PIN domain nuclease of toxin-antitoxin system
MSYLLDTHTFLWAAFSPNKLSAQVKKAIRSAENRVCLSSISFWEISIKYALGKIELEGCSPEDMPSIAEEMNLEIIQPTAAENASFYKLPRAEHKDPFDRMIIWQAIEQQLTLISKDKNFPAYKKLGLTILW